MTSPESPSIVREIEEHGPLTVAAFMDLALYHPRFGYYARAVQRSGRAGDFFTSVDVGPLFGELLEIQFEEMFRFVDEARPSDLGPRPLDLVEAGSGSGRLSADILRAARTRHPGFYDRIRLHLVDASAAARAAQPAVLGDSAERLASSAADLPESVEGVVFANELLDAMPVHQVVMREEGLREVFITGTAGPFATTLQLIEREPSTPALAGYLERAGVRLDIGARAEIGLAARDWIHDAAQRLRRGFIVVVDYGHEARELYSATHARGTLTSFCRHTMSGPDAATPAWLADPGNQDLTAHVDFTSVRAAAEAEGCATVGFLDQTYFLLGILEGSRSAFASLDDPRAARALKTLIMPGGLGSTMKVLILAKGVGTPTLKGCSFRVRVT